ncbi:eukaryotic translation initiation factor 5-like [Antedon mediterranea]|uniref:eukaryotic translation initiation factor 5-like n=1 Tax=Antedon mediterranea TaxID=105859 RepID=UPI003AF927EA
MSLNVNRNITDQFYRYKMPPIIAKVEGKGNGIKTVIVNMADVAKALNRPPTYTTKFFGCELGAQTQVDSKHDRYIVNGSHAAAKLQLMLDSFIKKFVLCTECDNPETNLIIKKERIGKVCKACGHRAPVDMRHKVTTYMTKHPPEESNTPKKDKEKANKGKKQSNGVAEQDSEIVAPERDDYSDDDKDWSVDTSQAAVAERMKDLTDGAKGLTLNDDLEKTQAERIDIFYKYVQKMKSDKTISETDSDKKLLAEAERLEVKDKAPLVLGELLLDTGIIEQLKRYRIHFLRFTHDNPKAQKYLLGAIEQLCGKVYTAQLIAKVPLILQKLYELDIVDEEVFVAWGSKPSKKYVSKEVSQDLIRRAAPFLKWLAEAEEEASEGEEEEVQVSFSSMSTGLEVKTVKDESKPPSAFAESDEINIDDI